MLSSFFEIALTCLEYGIVIHLLGFLFVFFTVFLFFMISSAFFCLTRIPFGYFSFVNVSYMCVGFSHPNTQHYKS